jgi:hypothetical protein
MTTDPELKALRALGHAAAHWLSVTAKGNLDNLAARSARVKVHDRFNEWAAVATDDRSLIGDNPETS